MNTTEIEMEIFRKAVEKYTRTEIKLNDLLSVVNQKYKF